MAPPPRFDRTRLANILGMLVASTGDAEKLAALGRANAIMTEAGVTWRDSRWQSPLRPPKGRPKRNAAVPIAMQASAPRRQRPNEKAPPIRNGRDDARRRSKRAARPHQSDDPLWKPGPQSD